MNRLVKYVALAVLLSCSLALCGNSRLTARAETARVEQNHIYYPHFDRYFSVDGALWDFCLAHFRYPSSLEELSRHIDSTISLFGHYDAYYGEILLILSSPSTSLYVRRDSCMIFYRYCGTLVSTNNYEGPIWYVIEH